MRSINARPFILSGNMMYFEALSKEEQNNVTEPESKTKPESKSFLLPLQQYSARLAANPDDIYLVQPRQNGREELSWREVDNEARRIANGLVSRGCESGDRVAILAKNSAEWVIADIACMMAGLISVPIYATAGEDTIRYILEHSEAKFVFVGKLDSTVAARAATAHIPTIGFPYAGVEASESWTDWLQKYEPLESINNPISTDIATIVYTSGSTGVPKGVVLEHDQMGKQAWFFSQTLPPPIQAIPHNRMLSYLPLAHITERSAVTFASFYVRETIYFVDSLETFIDDLKFSQPTIFISVPRLWVRFQAGVLAKIPARRLNFLLKIPILGKRVAAKVREQLGLSETVLFLTGSAPISIDTLKWYRSIGVEICEAWGMTETTGGICCNVPFDPEKLGTIGTPFGDTEMKLGENNEILIRGGAIFKRYYRNPEATDQAFVDGWFRTGDMGEVTAEGAWKITGRVKEQFKTAKGKYVAPVPIENKLLSNSLIEQVCVTGYGLSQPVALMVLNQELKLSRQEAEESLHKTLVEVNQQLESHQRLNHLIITESAWTTENDLLTPTLKLRRDQIEKRYNSLINTEHGSAIIWEKNA
ncbi:MAG: AMP-binding protein [bacterium]